MSLDNHIDRIKLLHSDLQSILASLDRCHEDMENVINNTRNLRENHSTFGAGEEIYRLFEESDMLNAEIRRVAAFLSKYREMILAMDEAVENLTMQMVYAPPDFPDASAFID